MRELYSHLPDTPLDPIMVANAAWPAFREAHPDAINTTIGVLIDPDTGKPWQPATVTRARLEAVEQISAEHEFGYQTQTGHQPFLVESGRLIFGPAGYAGLQEGLLAYQTSGGTGALSLARDILSTLKANPDSNPIPLVLDAGWPNHTAIFDEPFQPTVYQHVDPATNRYNHHAALDAVNDMPRGSVVLLQTCGYNDDGFDRTPSEWDEILDAAAHQEATVILDSAYVGLAEGTDSDCYPITQSVLRGLLTFICVSASKNMGLYNERVGSLFIVNAPEQLGDAQAKNLAQLASRIVRRTISNAPLSAAKAAAKALAQPEFHQELETARQRLVANRQAFADQLREVVPNVTEGRGLFTKLLPGGFSEQQLGALAAEGIFALPNSRFNLGGLRLDQIERVGSVIARVLENA